MKCPKCGAAVAGDDNFCEECGASLKTRSVNRTVEDCRGVFKSDIFAVDSNLAAATNIGRRHPTNEDAAAVIRSEDGSSILIVADGVSSAVDAESASVQAINKVREILSGGPAGDINLLRDAINAANDVIVKLPYETRDDGIYGPETTIVAASVGGENAVIGWVGDSRAYIIGEQSQELLTVDDSWVELIVEAGQMTRSQAELDRRAHYVTQVLGMHDQTMEIHAKEQKIEKGRMLLLCTDGLWNYFQGDNDLLKAIADFGMDKDVSEICEHLINLANIAGGHDNITIAILKNF